MAGGNDGSHDLVKLDDFEGEVDEHWRDARGSKVLDKNGDEVGTVEELYVWPEASTVHLLLVAADDDHFLLPVHAVTNVDEEGVKVETSKDTILGSPEYDSDEVPDGEARRAAYEYFGYIDPLDL
jgi:sporulation protein YlmC with PRC-barrel domain